MKKLKCPVCGTLLQFFHELKFGGLGRVGCSSCEWVTFLASPPQAWKAAEKFISKFPAIMRLRQGDNVLVWLTDDIHTVLGTDLEAGKIHLQDVYGDADSLYPSGIKKWPWELEQKGGDEQ